MGISLFHSRSRIRRPEYYLFLNERPPPNGSGLNQRPPPSLARPVSVSPLPREPLCGTSVPASFRL